MDALEIYNQLQPRTLIVKDRISTEALRLLKDLAAIRQQQKWDELDVSGSAVDSFRHRRADYPVLLLELGDGLMRAGRIPQAADCFAEAQGILQSEMTPGDQQNKAVAALYRGLVHQYLDRIADAVLAFGEARCQFKQSIDDWQAEAQGDARAEECRLADDQLANCVRELLLIRTLTSASAQPPAAEWEHVKPVELKPRLPFSKATTPSAREVGALGVAVAALLTVILGLAAHSFGGWKGTLAFLAAWIGMLIAAVLTARAMLGGRLRLKVPYEHTAVVEERSQFYSIGPGDLWLLIPGVSKVRATVPLVEQTYTLKKHRVPLGGTPGAESAAHLRMTIQVRYQVYDAQKATLLFEKEFGEKTGPRTPADLEAVWESRLVDDLKGLLVDEVWRHPAGECLAQRELIQTNLRHRLNTKAQAWGVNITGLSILEMEAQ